MKDELYDAIHEQTLIFAVLSHVKKGLEKSVLKIDIKPVVVKDVFHYQITQYFDQKVLHENVKASDMSTLLDQWLGPYFKQGVFYTADSDFQILYSKKMKEKILKKPPSRHLTLPRHNKIKNYVIPEGLPCDFMIHLGVMDETGRVYKKNYDKFRQLNKYLEFVTDALPHFDQDKPIRIVDFGCGKAYLTFALYYYLVKQLGLEVDIVGLDLKEDVIEFCNKTAGELGYTNLVFMKGDIREYQTSDDLDMVVSLHACDTATDEALIKAVQWGAKVIFAVPCCQHELFHQLNNPLMSPLLKHGVVKDKLAALITDTLRATALEIMGYEVQMLEFIDLAHTPKNILIRAYSGQVNKEVEVKTIASYESYKKAWQVTPYIDRLPKDKIE